MPKLQEIQPVTSAYKVKTNFQSVVFLSKILVNHKMPSIQREFLSKTFFFRVLKGFVQLLLMYRAGLYFHNLFGLTLDVVNFFKERCEIGMKSSLKVKQD